MQRTLRRSMNGEDVRLLHAVLNFHLPPPSDQLPTTGAGASDFGPRTEEKMKEFQKINRIDIDTPTFKDGVVGPNTRAVLESWCKGRIEARARSNRTTKAAAAAEAAATAISPAIAAASANTGAPQTQDPGGHAAYAPAGIHPIAASAP